MSSRARQLVEALCAVAPILAMVSSEGVEGYKPHTVKSPWRPQGTGKNPGDVWSMSTRPLPEAHCAPFPLDLPERCIAAGCPEAGRVLDPFSGAGTTGIAARQLGRFYQGIDLRADYHEIFLRRLAGDAAEDVRDLPDAA